MPVCFVSAQAGTGGSEKVLLSLLEELGPAWVESVVLFADGPLRGAVEALGHEPVVRPTPGPRGVAPAVWHLAGHVRSGGARVVHANGLKTGVVAALARLVRPVPVVWCRHDLCGEGRLANAVARQVDCVVGVSASVVAGLPETVRSRARVIPNGVRVPSLDRDAARARLLAELGLAPGARLVCLVGRLCDAKGQGELIAAAPDVLRQGLDVHFLLAGAEDENEPGTERRLREAAAAVGSGDRVHFLGYRTDAPAVIAGSDVLVAPSVRGGWGWEEGFGLVLVEAMATGTPVVAYANGALAETLGGCGALVAEGDRVGLAREIAGLLQDEARRAELSARGRARSAAGYSMEAFAAAYRKAYAETAAHGAGHRAAARRAARRPPA